MPGFAISLLAASMRSCSVFAAKYFDAGMVA